MCSLRTLVLSVSMRDVKRDVFYGFLGKPFGDSPKRKKQISWGARNLRITPSFTCQDITFSKLDRVPHKQLLHKLACFGVRVTFCKDRDSDSRAKKSVPSHFVTETLLVSHF